MSKTRVPSTFECASTSRQALSLLFAAGRALLRAGLCVACLPRGARWPRTGPASLRAPQRRLCPALGSPRRPQPATWQASFGRPPLAMALRLAHVLAARLRRLRFSRWQARRRRSAAWHRRPPSPFASCTPASVRLLQHRSLGGARRGRRRSCCPAAHRAGAPSPRAAARAGAFSLAASPSRRAARWLSLRPRRAVLFVATACFRACIVLAGWRRAALAAGVAYPTFRLTGQHIAVALAARGRPSPPARARPGSAIAGRRSRRARWACFRPRAAWRAALPRLCRCRSWRRPGARTCASARRRVSPRRRARRQPLRAARCSGSRAACGRSLARAALVAR